ncbi:MAG: hypothetical protein AAGK14_15680 [Verrucomicrobiota bacterium]
MSARPTFAGWVRRAALVTLALSLLAAPISAAASTETQTKQLLDGLIPYAHGVLERTGSFSPFGGGLSPDGKVHFMSGKSPDGQRLDAAGLRALLVDSLPGMVQPKGFVAAAVLSDTTVRDPQSRQLVRAVRADLRFRGGQTETLFIPYSQNNEGKLSFRPSIKNVDGLR